MPDKPFDAGERVSVDAVDRRAAAQQRRVDFSFRVATPYPTAAIPAFPNPPAPRRRLPELRLRCPACSPPILNVTAPDRDPAAGDLMMTTGPGPGQYGPLIYTPQGRSCGSTSCRAAKLRRT